MQFFNEILFSSIQVSSSDLYFLVSKYLQVIFMYLYWGQLANVFTFQRVGGSVFRWKSMLSKRVFQINLDHLASLFGYSDIYVLPNSSQDYF